MLATKTTTANALGAASPSKPWPVKTPMRAVLPLMCALKSPSERYPAAST
jgi:hypothetical protein